MQTMQQGDTPQEAHLVALEALARVKTLEVLFFVLNEHGPAERPADETAEAYEGLVCMAREQLMRSLGHTREANVLMLENLGIDLPEAEDQDVLQAAGPGPVREASADCDVLMVRSACALARSDLAQAHAASCTRNLAALNTSFERACAHSAEVLAGIAQVGAAARTALG